MKNWLYTLIACLFPITLTGQNLLPVGKGWSNNSVNVTVFRKNSLVTHGDIQFIAYYDPSGDLTLGKRNIREKEWTLHKTPYKGNVNDAHNIISIMVDGDGYLHVAWDHHGHPLRYARGKAPLSLELGDKQAMTGKVETNVTYPEFFRMPDGDLIFMYRDGQSGRGNLVINRYDLKAGRWEQVHDNLINGENIRNAYWQACVDRKGIIHLSWVWRETWDVSTNHDMCYARSKDGGKTWETSAGKTYRLPIDASNAEYAVRVPQNSELINQTSITTDQQGHPYIASYWKDQDSDVPQYHVIYHDGKAWKTQNLGFRQTPFSLKGGGTKRIPISRPQIVVRKGMLNLLFRDEEREGKVSMATCRDLRKNQWDLKDLTSFSVGDWEPSYDTELWKKKGRLNVFVQKVTQVDGEGKANVDPQMIYVLETK